MHQNRLKANNNDSNRGLRMILMGVIIFLVLGLFIFIIGYLLYNNLPGDPENLVFSPVSYENETGTLSEIGQFIPNMKFNHNDISYRIDNSCEQNRINRMIEAFGLLSEEIDTIKFHSVSGVPDIEVTCSLSVKESLNGDDNFFVAGEGGAKEIIKAGRFNVINKGIILLYGNFEDSVECDWANVELHELMHVFGFNHSINTDSLMYPTIESCNQRLDNSIILELDRLYSQENLADLYFKDVQAVKKGIYLDFNVTVLNSGVKDANNVNISILTDDKLIESRELSNIIRYGGGITLNIENFKMNKRNPKKISFVIDQEGLVEEYDKENNVVEVEF